jgi:hypothetical protein
VDGKAPAAQFAANVLIQAAGEMSLDEETNIGFTIIEANFADVGPVVLFVRRTAANLLAFDEARTYTHATGIRFAAPG